VASREHPELKIYPLPGTPLPWTAKAMHSQGMSGVRADFIDTEMDRMRRYTAKGDILPHGELERFFAECESAG